MRQIVYIDVLMAVNLFINYFLLLASARLLRISAGRLRLVAGAALGAAYSLAILLPAVPLWLSLVTKLLTSASMVLISFPVGTARFFLRAAACFYLMSFAFAGLMLGLWYFLSPQGMVVKNSVVYFDVSPICLLLLTVVCYCTIRLLERALGQRQQEETLCRVMVRHNGKSADFTAKIDTGSSLMEPFSGFPVIVAEHSAVEALAPEGMGTPVSVAPGSGLRLIPFSSLGGQGVLQAFRPDSVEIHTVKTKITAKEVYLAVYHGRLAPPQFRGLVNPQILSQGEQLNRKGKEH